MGSPALGMIVILQQSIGVRGGMGLSLIPSLSAPTSSVTTACSGRESGVFSGGMAVDTKGLGHGIGCLACRDSLGDLLP